MHACSRLRTVCSRTDHAGMLGAHANHLRACHHGAINGLICITPVPPSSYIGSPRVPTQPKSVVLCSAAAKVYLSEGRDAARLRRLQEVASTQPHVALGHVFVDEPYNRVNLTLASEHGEAVCTERCGSVTVLKNILNAPQLASAAVRLARAAIELLDLRQHAASHPRLGVVDHISLQPAGLDSALHAAAEVAQAIGDMLGVGPPPVPVLLYGAAHPRGRGLQDVRRSLGYFRGASAGQWTGAISASDGFEPDYGPRDVDPAVGVACIGATPWVTNLNVPLETDDVDVCRRIARLLSARGGGLAHVEAMALPHTSGVEIACNLLSEDQTSVAAVIERVQQLAADERVRVCEGPLGSDAGAGPYVLGLTREQLVQTAREQLTRQRQS